MRNWIQNFMRGRYGADQLGRFLNILVMVLLVLSLFRRLWFLYLPALVFLIYSYFRMFSRNFGARSLENQRYLRMTDRMRAFFRNLKQNRTSPYRIYPCPGCGQKIRVPKGKGKIEITCPKCGETFRKRT